MQVQPTQSSTPYFKGGDITFLKSGREFSELFYGKCSELTVNAKTIVDTKPLNVNVLYFLRELGISVQNSPLMANLTKLFENMSTIVLSNNKVYMVKAPKAVIDETVSRILKTDEDATL